MTKRFFSTMCILLLAGIAFASCPQSLEDDALTIPGDFGKIQESGDEWYTEEIPIVNDNLKNILKTLKEGSMSTEGSSHRLNELLKPARIVYDVLETPPDELQAQVAIVQPKSYTKILDSMKYDVKAVSINYESTYAVKNEQSPLASAAILYPDAETSGISPNKPLPIVLYLRDMGVDNEYSPYKTYGETRLSDSVKIEMRMSPQYGSDIIVASFLAAQGNIVIVPDYLGFGASIGYGSPYMVVDVLAKDTLEALIELPNYFDKAKVNITSDPRNITLIGFGQAALVATEIDSLLANENGNKYVFYDIKRAIIGGGIFDPLALVTDISGNTAYPRSFLIPFIYQGFVFSGLISEVESEDNYLPKSSIFNNHPQDGLDFGLDFAEVFSGSTTYEKAVGLFNKDMTALLRDEFRIALQQNTIADDEFKPFLTALTDIQAPLFSVSDVTLLHSPNDEIVPASQTNDYAMRMLRQATNTPLVIPPPQTTVNVLDRLKIADSFNYGMWFFTAFYAMLTLIPAN